MEDEDDDENERKQEGEVSRAAFSYIVVFTASRSWRSC